MPGTEARSPKDTDFIDLSAELGRDPLLIQASGGNTSVKEDGLLWVKASGKELARAHDEPIFVPVDFAGVRAAIDRDESDPATPHVVGSTSLRPSIETTLHALLPHRVVVHVHSVNTLAWTTREDGPARIGEAMDGLAWAWVPYRRPGLPLTRMVQEVLDEDTDILVLQNHGLVIGGDGAGEVDTRLREAERRLLVPPRPTSGPGAGLSASSDESDEYAPAQAAVVHALGTDPDCFRKARGGALYPDHVVFLGPEAPIAERGRSWDEARDDYRARHREPPQYLIVEGEGVLLRRDHNFGVAEMLECQAEVLARVGADVSLRYLTDTEVAELMNWDAETYRKTLNR